jgi:glycosyl transferase, family 25
MTLSGHILDRFEQVRIVNLVDRPDRRREVIAELDRIGGLAPNISFYEAHRPEDAGGFPSLGARGCFESHLAVLRSARDAGARNLLILEDDVDFTRDGPDRLAKLVPQLFGRRWDFFYGAHLLAVNGRQGLVEVPATEPVATTSFVAIDGGTIQPFIEFLEGVMSRPPGSPDYGPMHVDGAYTVFRLLNLDCITLAAFPPLARQRSSPSDVSPSNMILDRWSLTGRVAALLRRLYNKVRR